MDAIHANCECAAVWCKTGAWATVQGRNLLGNVSIGSAKGVAAAGAAAASTQVTVTTAAPGIWGFFGGTMEWYETLGNGINATQI